MIGGCGHVVERRIRFEREMREARGAQCRPSPPARKVSARPLRSASICVQYALREPPPITVMLSGASPAASMPSSSAKPTPSSVAFARSARCVSGVA